MTDHCSYLYVHIVWATHRRAPWLTRAITEKVHSCILASCEDEKCTPLAIGGMSDHVHLVVRMHPSVSVATLAKRMKGASSHLVTHRLSVGDPFHWQRGYGAFSLGVDQVEAAVEYVRRQEAHHAAGDVLAAWEAGGEETEGIDA